jgi:hypothetical protein
MLFDGGVFVVIVNMFGVIAVLVLVFVFAMLVFTVRFVKGFGFREIVMSGLVAVLDSVHVGGFGGVTDRFAGQYLGVDGDGNLW